MPHSTRCNSANRTSSVLQLAPSKLPVSSVNSAKPRKTVQRRNPIPASSAELEAWLAKYLPVERAIMEEREKRLASITRNRATRSRRFGDLCEATEGKAVIWRRDRLSLQEMIGLANGDVFTIKCLLAYMGKTATRKIDALRHRLKRPFYYAQENARRRRLAAERRKVTPRSTTNPCPTREEVLDAWLHAKDSRESMLHFGGMMEDLECYVDNSLRFSETGEVAGRAPGIKGWLIENIPALAIKYKTVMRYKAAAKKLRQMAGLKDPIPTSSMLEIPNTPKTTADDDIKGYHDDYRTVEVLRARAVYLEAMEGIPDNITQTILRINELLDPNRIDDTTLLSRWRQRYENEISMRTKSKWARRLFRRTG